MFVEVLQMHIVAQKRCVHRSQNNEMVDKGGLDQVISVRNQLFRRPFLLPNYLPPAYVLHLTSIHSSSFFVRGNKEENRKMSAFYTHLRCASDNLFDTI